MTMRESKGISLHIGSIFKERVFFSRVLLDLMIFFYFLTLSGELLNVPLGIFKPRANHIFAILLMFYTFRSKKRVVIDKELVIPFFALFVSFFISGVLGDYVLRSLGYTCIYLFTITCYFIVPYNLFIFFGGDRVFKIYMMSFLVLGVYSLMQVVFSFGGIFLPFVTQYAGSIARGQGWNYEPSYYALMMTQFVMFYNSLALMSTDKKINWIYFAFVNLLLIVSTSTGIVLSYPSFALLYLLAGSVGFLKNIITNVKKKAMQLILFFISSMALLWIMFPLEFIRTFYKFFDYGITKHWSVVERWNGIVNASQVFIEHPFFGVGVGGVGSYIYKLKENGCIPMTLRELEKYDPTNALTEIAASVGIFGLLAYLLLARSFWIVFKRVINEKNNVSLHHKRVIVSLFISLVSALFVLQFNQGLFRSYLWVHAAVVFGYMRYIQSLYAKGPLDREGQNIKNKEGL
ncbi:MAG: hypothetical protein FJZ57_05425 [Chlamydiae bacterium]|nr:hypothetical protein [Chlamydiota bacterium]